MKPRRRLHNLLWVFLFPLSYVWAAVTYLRRRFYPREKRYRSRLTVVCVGNVHSGGSGKTPLVLELAQHFRARNPVILSRGYKGVLTVAGGRVDLDNPAGPTVFGDEPWMLAHRSRRPVYIGRDRVQQIKRIEMDEESPLVILDDGFQHLALWRNMDIVAINPRNSVEESFCLPWGQLREPLSALRRAGAVVLMGGSDAKALAGWRAFLGAAVPTVPVFQATRQSSGLWAGDERCELPGGAKLAAFCGIADPEGFREDLAQVSEPIFLRSFPDHHTYTTPEIDEIVSAAQLARATHLVTTDKDWAKAQPLLAAKGLPVLSLRIRYEIPNEFWYFLDHRLETV